MAQDIPERDRAGLREFGLVVGSTIALLFGLVIPWLFDLGFPAWPWVAGGILVARGLVAPDSLRHVYVGWMRFALLLNRVTTPLILGTVFFLLFTPIALLMKIRGRDSMARRFDADAESYRVPSKKPPKEQMEKPF